MIEPLPRTRRAAISKRQEPELLATQPAPAAAPNTVASGRSTRRRAAKPSCEGCYFGRRGLCALELDGPCSTFRPDSPNGLVPPTQPMLLVREPDAACLAA